MTGIEPVTSSLPRKRSTPELHRLVVTFPSESDGAEDEIRTRDIQLGRLTLYQLSYSRLTSMRLFCGGNRIRTYSVIDNRFTVCPGSPTPAYPLENHWSVYGAGGGIRTPDPLITNQLLWPTELHRPVSKNKGKKSPPRFREGKCSSENLGRNGPEVTDFFEFANGLRPPCSGPFEAVSEGPLPPRPRPLRMRSPSGCCEDQVQRCPA